MRYYILPFIFIIVVLAITLGGNFLPNGGQINMKQKIESKVFDKYDSEFLFVYFGYVGCRDVCTPRLDELSVIYDELRDKKVDIDTVFINMIPLLDKELPRLFAELFNDNFHGLYLENDKLQELQSEFKIYINKSLIDEYSWDHTSFLFLLHKSDDGYIIKRIYTYVPFNQKHIIDDILSIITI